VLGTAQRGDRFVKGKIRARQQCGECLIRRCLQLIRAARLTERDGSTRYVLVYNNFRGLMEIGFETGMSWASPKLLPIWEAQVRIMPCSSLKAVWRLHEWRSEHERHLCRRSTR